MITFFISRAYLIPKPSQEEQAPFGELNENDKGSSGSKEILQENKPYVQNSEYVFHPFLHGLKLQFQVHQNSFKPFSTSWAILSLFSSFYCNPINYNFNCVHLSFANSISSSSLTITPSIMALT